ncbi:hypothetical protein fugu_003075 [Takifugu bimaculatus]|uniref:TNF receptor-associated factor n=1 Tax=Takifugu bimaculatus TaxID=433685 RepID=A0A4Z2BGV6_9TELE|nr:hypothetical protein fugu_003075 [Takifugu bimaculatus]
MACFDSSKESLEDSFDGAVGGKLSGCALAMSEKERESLLNPSESPSTYMSGASSSFQDATHQQGYDVEFDPPLESKYECPICLMALRNAIQTPCGHRFCKICIEKSIRDAGQRCPVDNEMLSKEQLFPDNFAKREILSLTVRCSNPGCTGKMELRHLEDHLAHCQFATVPCPHCQQSVRKTILEEHMTAECRRRPVSCPDCIETFVYEERERHEQQCPFASVMCPYCDMDLVRDQDILFPSRTMEHQRHPVTKECRAATAPPASQMRRRRGLREMDRRLVKQDHQLRELIILKETQAGQLAELGRRVSMLEETVRELESQHCTGIFIWRLKDFSVLLRNQEAGLPVVEHSPAFYTGRPGYKLCLRLHLQSPNAQRCSNFISLFVHTMQGAFDGLLTWPFQGTIRLAILDQGPEGQHHVEVMETKPDLQAFQKPTIIRNPKGFGYVTFLHLQHLNQRAYVKDDILLIRCEVTPRFDNMFHRDGITVQPRGPEASMMRD